MGINDTVNNRLDHFNHNILDIVRLQNLAALLVDNLTLLIHDVIILKDDFTDIEVVAFNTFLGGFYSARNHAALNRLILFKTKTVHHVQHVVRTKTLHQFVAERQVELSGTRVSLTSRASAQLVVDPA
ncbi:hypothetical protein D3C86_1819600 [compost metagenome]